MIAIIDLQRSKVRHHQMYVHIQRLYNAIIRSSIKFNFMLPSNFQNWPLLRTFVFVLWKKYRKDLSREIASKQHFPGNNKSLKVLNHHFVNAHKNHFRLKTDGHTLPLWFAYLFLQNKRESKERRSHPWNKVFKENWEGRVLSSAYTFADSAGH